MERAFPLARNDELGRLVTAPPANPVRFIAAASAHVAPEDNN